MLALCCSWPAHAVQEPAAAPREILRPAAPAVAVAVAGTGPAPAGRECTLRVADPAEAAAARPGDVVCFTGELADRRLVLRHGGRAGAPITYSGRGTVVAGITVEADHVVVEGFRAERPQAPGVELTGEDLTLRDTLVLEPRGGDGDGIRFFGRDLRILGNTVRGTHNTGSRHADCVQTFADGTPPSQDVLIQGNRCEEVDNMCLMAEGPNDGEGDGHGTTARFTLRDNYCDTRDASQALMFEDVRQVTVTGNTFPTPLHHAIGLALHSTGAHVGENTYHPGIGYEVGIDSSSRPGYQGPPPGGAP